MDFSKAANWPRAVCVKLALADAMFIWAANFFQPTENEKLDLFALPAGSKRDTDHR